MRLLLLVVYIISILSLKLSSAVGRRGYDKDQHRIRVYHHKFKREYLKHRLRSRHDTRHRYHRYFDQDFDEDDSDENIWRRHRRRYDHHMKYIQQADPTLANCGKHLSSRGKRSDGPHSRHYHNLRKRILGGKEAAPNGWPWHVFFRYKNGKVIRQCSGTLLSKRWFITSAQCIVSKDPKDYMVVLGEHDLTKNSGHEKFRLVAKVDVPKVYNNNTLLHDIAMVELAQDAPIGSTINYACIPPQSSYVQPGTKCYMTGWGKKKASSGTGFAWATKLQQLHVTVTSEISCQRALKKTLLSTQICAGTNDWRGGCKFDEGSPLMCYNSQHKKWFLQGIFSFSNNPCSATGVRYSVFTRVSMYAVPIIKTLARPPTTTAPTKMSTKSTAAARTTKTPYKTTTKASTTIKVPPIPTKQASTKAVKTKIPPILTVKPTKASTTKSTRKPGNTTKVIPAKTTTSPTTTTKSHKPVSLKIHMRSEGCDDMTKTDTCGRSYILVNGVDYSQHKQGHNVVIVDLKTGKIENSLAFDTSSKVTDAWRLLRFLKGLGLRKVVLVVIQGDGSKYQEVVQKELVKFGATLPGEISYRSSFCLLGYSGPERVTWIRQNSRPRYKGPSEILQQVPLPDSKKVLRVRARSESCTRKDGKVLCGRSYIWVNGMDYSKHVDGHNIVVLDFDQGNVVKAEGYPGKNKTSALEMQKVLTSLSFRKIVIVVMQGDATDFHSVIRQRLGKFGASSTMELTLYSTYAFIGYTGPERVSWTTERWKPRELGPTDVSVYIRKGLYVCGLQYIPPANVLPFVVGGRESREGQWPWMGAIIDGNGKFVCGSSLINRQWVVTAAHCLRLLKSRPHPHRIALGDKYYASSKAHVVKIASIIPHPDYNMSTHSNDVALLKLASEAPVKHSIRTICLNEQEQFKTGKMCYIVGWGRIMEGGPQSPLMRHTSVPLVNRDVCNHARSYRGKVLSNMICAGYAKGGKDACQGDSGGPLACQNRDGYWYLTGIVSWGYGCASPHLYGVYVKVSALASWIKTTIAAAP